MYKYNVSSYTGSFHICLLNFSFDSCSHTFFLTSNDSIRSRATRESSYFFPPDQQFPKFHHPYNDSRERKRRRRKRNGFNCKINKIRGD